MRRIASKRARKGAVAVVALVGALVLGACSAPAPAENLAVQDADEGRTVNFFSPMEKISPDTENTARTASDLTITMAEERARGSRWPITPTRPRTTRTRPTTRCAWSGPATIRTICTC